MKAKKFLTVGFNLSPSPSKNNTSKNENTLLQPLGYFMLKTKYDESSVIGIASTVTSVISLQSIIRKYCSSYIRI